MSYKWFAEDIKAVQTGYANGVPTAHIAGRLGLTKNQVIGRANRLGLTHKSSPSQATRRHNAKLSKTDVLLIRKARLEGGARWGRKALARRFNVSAVCIYYAAIGRTWGHLGKV